MPASGVMRAASSTSVRYQPYHTPAYRSQPFRGNCLPTGMPICFRCGRPGHVVRNCTQAYIGGKIQATSVCCRVEAASANSKVQTSVVSAAGRLISCYLFWRDVLKANKFVLNIIELGYAIPFVSLPDSCYLKNKASSLKQENFV